MLAPVLNPAVTAIPSSASPSRESGPVFLADVIPEGGQRLLVEINDGSRLSFTPDSQGVNGGQGHKVVLLTPPFWLIGAIVFMTTIHWHA